MWYRTLLFVLMAKVSSELQQFNQIHAKIEDALCKLQCYEELFPSCSSGIECDCKENTTRAWAGSKIYTKIDLQLKCKSADIFQVTWDDNINTFSYPEKRIAYFLNVTKDNEEYFTDIIFCNHYTISSTAPNTTYIVTLWGLNNKSDIFVSKALTIRTNIENVIPAPIKNVSITLTPRAEDHEATVNWIPGEDLACYYEIIFVCVATKNMHDVMPPPESYLITDPNELFTINLDELHFGYSYNVTIKAKSAEFGVEGPNTTLSIKIPTCVETFFDLSRCEPDPPQNLSVIEMKVTNGFDGVYHDYNIYMNWSAPELPPSYYVAKLTVAYKNRKIKNNITTMNITGVAVSAIFEHVKLEANERIAYYQVYLQAVSQGGVSQPAIVDRLAVNPAIKSSETRLESFRTLLIIIGVLGGVLILVLLSIPAVKQIPNRTSTKKSQKQNMQYNENYFSDKQITTKPIDHWEISIDDLLFKSILGEGAFGVVWRALIGPTQVACKTLKDNCTNEEIRQLDQEIEIMKSVGFHPNIVSIIGCVTQNVTNGPILVVEYCPQGDLLTYLRSLHDDISNQVAQMKNNTRHENNKFSNLLYEIDATELKMNTLTENDIKSFGWQISMGMEYLANQKVLHRDLAARNILMCDDKKVKVSDFGLSRDVYINSVYFKNTNGKLPIRWMAPESLTHQLYTTKSDVWAFGVLLWEISSLGCLPYPGIESHELLDLITGGERMSRPYLCPQEIYSIMLKCWEKIPNERPSFSSLRAVFEKLLAHQTDYLEF